MQLLPALSDPPLRAMVLVLAVVVSVPPHDGMGRESATDSPAGKTSEKAMTFNAWLPDAVLLIVNVSVVFNPLIIGLGEKTLVIVGAGAGIRQPVNVMAS